MKFMGSKKSMLNNGLGQLLLEETNHHKRFIDLFSGSSTVCHFVAERVSIPVIANDLQYFSTVLAESIISRDFPITETNYRRNWFSKIDLAVKNSREWKEAQALANRCINIEEWVTNSRNLCASKSDIGPCWNSYGGYYYSPTQAIALDFMLQNIPEEQPKKSVYLASIIEAASECAASPGHTAQPFKPTPSAAPFIKEAWSKNPILYVERKIDSLSNRYALVKGEAYTQDALAISSKCCEGDLVFVDPPYSNMQYSRFYHVLEVIAKREKEVKVSGAGRYVENRLRPRSQFSCASESLTAITSLFSKLGNLGVSVILTFPSWETSNRLSSELIKEIAAQWFMLVNSSTRVVGKFSTLGGNNKRRVSRTKSSEDIMLFKPR